MGATSCVLKLILGIVNSIFLLVGIAISALGGILLAMANNSGFSKFLEDTIEDILENIGLLDKEDILLLQYDFAGMLQPAGTVILIFGLVVLGISIVGYVGLSCSNVVLTVYLVIIIILLIIQTVLVAVFFSGALNNVFREQATFVIEKKYVGLQNGNIYSVGPNVIMSQLKCCGLDNYTDFYRSETWVRNVTLRDQDKREYQAYLLTPEVCCKVGEGGSVEDFNCATNPTDSNSNYQIGCWTEIIKKIDEYETPAILVSCAVLVIQAILIIFVLIIVCEDS